MSLQAYNSATDTLTPIAENDYKDSLEKISALPTASADLLNKCYLLTTNQTGYKKGGIYQCQVVPESDPTEYAWVLISSSPLVGGKGITIEDDTVNADTNVFNGTLDEWEALTAEEKAQYSHIATPDEASGGTDAYSTTETKTNKVWIDGKPIYRKAFHYDSLTVAGDYLVWNDVETIISQGGSQVYDSTEKFIFPWIFSGSTNNERLYFLVKNNNGLYRRVEYDVTKLSDMNWWVEYTKTTD